MASQRELLDRAAAAHLEDFRQELSTQAIETISFALATVGPSTAAPPRVPALPAAAGRIVPRPSSSVTGLPTAGLDDQPTGEVVELTAANGRRRRTVLAASLAAVAGVAVALAIWLVTRPRDSASEARGAAPTVAPPPAVAVAPTIDAGVVDPPVDAAAMPDAAPVAVAVRPGRGSGTGSAPRPGGGTAKDPPEVADEAALRAKFQAVNREYKQYKAEFGPRLEAEWTDLASMVGFLSNPERRGAFDKKLDQLRARMRSDR